MGKEQILAYEAPVVEVIEVEVEKGFAVSGINPSTSADSDMNSGTGGF